MCVCVYQHSWGQNINGCFTRYILLWHVCQGLTWDYGADGFNGFVTSREANFESGLHIYIYIIYIMSCTCIWYVGLRFTKMGPKDGGLVAFPKLTVCLVNGSAGVPLEHVSKKWRVSNPNQLCVCRGWIGTQCNGFVMSDVHAVMPANKTRYFRKKGGPKPWRIVLTGMLCIANADSNTARLQYHYPTVAIKCQLYSKITTTC